MQFDAIAPYLIETHCKITRVLDGDSFMVQNIFSKDEKEIRLYGLDAPENKRNRKLIEDEKKARVAGEFLIQLGRKSTDFVLTIAPPGTNITLITVSHMFPRALKKPRKLLIYKALTCVSADRTGLEPATSAVTGRHSNQLNYRSKPLINNLF
jgi:hypothetical protein